MLNLKIPQYNGKTNSIVFKSVHLDFFNENKKYENNNFYYCCKVIDSVFQNNSEKIRYELDSKYFCTNFIYIKGKKDNNYKFRDKEKIKIYPKSIVFCEIKKSFPNIQRGKENIYHIKVNDPNEKKEHI